MDIRSCLKRLYQNYFDRVESFSVDHPRLAAITGFAKRRKRPLFATFIFLLHVVGFFMSISAIKDSRTPQGATAWAISLNTMPVIAVPAYSIFGDSRLDSYILARRAGLSKSRPMAELLIENINAAKATPESSSALMDTISSLTSMPVTVGNHADLLIDGKDTFKSIFNAIEAATDYVLVQFYIVRSDELGSDLKELLIKKAREGVRVYVLYDDVGSLGLPSAFSEDLRKAGVTINSFMNFGNEANRMQLNFRNHRKIVVVDGKVGFIGGHNVGDEYLGKHPTLTPWRDSHLRVTGPVVANLQIPFVEDWHWARNELIPDLKWNVSEMLAESEGSMEAVCVPSGPGDPMETCALFFLAAINEAKERVWIATPYFVPDKAIVLALQLAAARGVDVKILIPAVNDSKLVYLSSFSYIDELDKAGIKIHRYNNGFMHQKVILVDNDFTTIGSANFDNRSFRLNFEAGIAIKDAGFNREVANMLTDDFAKSTRVKPDDLSGRSKLFQLSVEVARLLAPIQ